MTRQVALVTGASSGIGKATAELLASNGYYVFAMARRIDRLEQMRTDNIEPIGLDVTDAESIRNAVNYAMNTKGRIDVLVNNAGYGQLGAVECVSMEAAHQQFEVNVFGYARFMQEVLPHMRTQKAGCIINITSGAARYSQKGFSSYGSCKAALTQMTVLNAADFAPKVRVNAIAPGSIMTDALSQFLTDEPREKMIELTPMKALGQPEDIAAAALYLASPACRWVTGKVLEIDGGAESTTWPF